MFSRFYPLTLRKTIPAHGIRAVLWYFLTANSTSTTHYKKYPTKVYPRLRNLAETGATKFWSEGTCMNNKGHWHICVILVSLTSANASHLFSVSLVTMVSKCYRSITSFNMPFSNSGTMFMTTSFFWRQIIAASIVRGKRKKNRSKLCGEGTGHFYNYLVW